MSLTLHSPELHHLASEIAAMTGESVEDTINPALEERLTRLRTQAVRDQLLAIGRDCASRIRKPWRTTPHGDLLRKFKNIKNFIDNPRIQIKNGEAL